MKNEERAAILGLLTEIQEKSAKITVQIGHTNPENQKIHHNTLFIQDAPPIVAEKLQEKGYRLEQHPRLGMQVITE